MQIISSLFKIQHNKFNNQIINNNNHHHRNHNNLNHKLLNNHNELIQNKFFHLLNLFKHI